MRMTLLGALTLLSTLASTAMAQEEAKGGILTPRGGLMFWTVVIFAGLYFVLRRWAFPVITAAVEAREKALEDALEGAKRDREEAARLLNEQRLQIEAARTEAQRFIAEGRAAGEKIRVDMLEQTRAQQQELLERARRDIDAEKERAIAEMRREAVELAIAGAGKVIEKNLDDQQNRRLVESFLSTLTPGSVRV
ncbi:MAG: F0F1 ATP synthase subunit B [Gemmatimonadaceae bacterium]